MLKWTAKRDAFQDQDATRRSASSVCTTPGAARTSSAQKQKRRQSSTGHHTRPHRRASTGCKRSSFGLELDKENQYTSTPIKDEVFQQDAFRDLSNLTPKALYTPPPKKKKKKKKGCLEEPQFDHSHCFKAFEAVDSHIEGSFLPLRAKDQADGECGCSMGVPGPKRYAPTLPTYAIDYSPPTAAPLTSQPLKMDHVNDFLKRISLIASPEELQRRLPGYRPKKAQSPNLVRRFLDRRFGATRASTSTTTTNDDSSFINDLSLDQIVDAILETTSDCGADNERNRSKEENLVNEEKQQQQLRQQVEDVTNTSSSSITTTSTDSGFRSSATESSAAKSTAGDEQTMINLEGTFNERCVDVPASRKRPSSEETSLSDNEDATSKLKRQKCIRQKRQKRESIDLSLDSTDCTYVVASPATFCSANSSSASTSKCREIEARGTIDLELRSNEDALTVTVLKCADLRRHNGHPVNAYIKVALSERHIDGRRKHRGTLQRTAVQPESRAPSFAHTFRVPLQPDDVHFKVLYVEVWHRDRMTRRSEFLGCASFAVKDALKENITGTFKLLPQWCATVRQAAGILNSNNNDREEKDHHGHTMIETQHTSIDELIAEEHIDGNEFRRGKAALSEQQKSADENLFLRYLELDPVEGPEAAPALAQRKASGNKTNGRTPFTMTKVLRRTSKGGFGFSVVWTHPPRIERVERHLPADKAGLQPGDYLIFVEKHNVVVMPEVDILNVIRSLGNQLTLEIFRRDPNRNGALPTHAERTTMRVVALSGLAGGGQHGHSQSSIAVERLERLERATFDSGSMTGLPLVASSLSSVAAPLAPASTATPRRPSTVCSTNTASVEYSRKKLHLPQVTFSSERPTNSWDDARRKALYQIIAREQQYATSMQFAVARYVHALLERRDLIGQQDHRTLFQNCEELLRISEEVIDHLIQVDGDYHSGSVIKVYAAKVNEMAAAYKRYCSGIKKADCVLANLMRGQEFLRFIASPAIPRRRPDLTSFIHKPLEHYREILKLFNVVLTNTKTNQTEEYNIVNHIVHDLQVHYREMTSQAGLMEPVGEGRPLLSVQDLETRLVFTKCKPFVLSKPGRQWIFGGDLSRVEGRTMRQYWALLFSDILLFAKVSRDRVLFILEDPLPLAHITDMFFNVRKKENEFRIVVEPGDGAARTAASSPTVHCGPDLSRTPRKNPSRRCIILRTPTVELKAVWQNLLQRQIVHISTSGTDGSTLSSPAESPDCQPMKSSSVATLQSAESLSRSHLQRHQHLQQEATNHRFTAAINPLAADTGNGNESRKQLDELIEHKCKQLEKSSCSSKSNAIHLEQWMKGQYNNDLLNNNQEDTDGEGDDLVLWSDEQIKRRSEELKLIGPLGIPRTESGCEEPIGAGDEDESPSRSTNTTESQVTVRSSPLVPASLSMCKNCHKTCYNPHPKRAPLTNGYKTHVGNRNHDLPDDDEDEWRSLMGLMGLNVTNLDPFSIVPQIAVLPATPTPDSISRECDCTCTPTKSFELELSKSYDNSPDDSPMNETGEQPYHSLHSSNLTLRRFGTVSSLERIGSEEDTNDAQEDSETSDETETKATQVAGIDNEGFNNAFMTWTARAGSFVAAKMAFLEKLPEYLKTEITVNGDDLQEEETSGGTSGEEIWGTPTSGGELEDPLSSPPYDDRNSPNGGGSVSSNEDTELMMDELLMTPPVTSATIRGLLPRRTLEPLMEEEFSDTYTSSSSASPTPTEPSVSPEQGNETGDAADECLSAAVTPAPPSPVASRSATSTTKDSSALGTRLEEASLRSTSTTLPTSTSTSIAATMVAVCNPMSNASNPNCNAIGCTRPANTVRFIKRSDSYQKIIEAEDDNVGFFTRFRNRPSMRYANIERIPATRGAKFLEFFNVRRERKIYETFPGGKHLMRQFSREEDAFDDVPKSFASKPEILQRIKHERQLDRRFWKYLSKRRNSNSPNRQNMSTSPTQKST